MKKQIFAIALLATMLVSILCGCGKTATVDLTTAKVTPEEAQQIVMDALGITQEQFLSPSVHYGEYDGDFCYNVIFATLEKDYQFVVSATTGEILLRSDEIETTTGGQEDDN